MASLLVTILVSIVVGFVGYVAYMLMTGSRKSSADIENEEQQLLEQKRVAAQTLKEKKKPDKAIPKHLSSTTKNKFSNSTDKKDHSLFYREVGGHVAAASCIAFSAKNGLVASCSNDGTVRCLPFADIGVANAHEVYANFEGVPTAVAFTQNAKRVVVAVVGVLKYFSVAIGPDSKKLEHVKDLNTGMSAITSLQLLDVEHWMTIIVCGLDEAGGPCIRAFDHKGHRITNLVQVKRKGRADKHRPPLPKKALAAASPDDRCPLPYPPHQPSHTIAKEDPLSTSYPQQ